MARIFIDDSIDNSLIDGLILSDAYIAPIRGKALNCNFRLNQKIGHQDWLENIKNRFDSLNIRSTIYKSIRNNSTFGFHFYDCLYAQNHKLFTIMRERWYLDGEKIVPDDLKLTPLVLADWICGDGSTGWTKLNLASNILFHTESFSHIDILKLIKLLKELDFSPWIRCRNTCKGEIIGLSRSHEVKKLLQGIDKFIPPYFKYKIKIPVGLSRSEA